MHHLCSYASLATIWVLQNLALYGIFSLALAYILTWHDTGRHRHKHAWHLERLILHQHSQEWDFSFQRCSTGPSFRGWLFSILPASTQKSSLLYVPMLLFYFYISRTNTWDRHKGERIFFLAHRLRGFSSSWWSEMDEQFVSYHDRPRNKKERMLLLWWHYTFLHLFFLLFFSSPQVVQPVFRFFLLLFLFFGNVFTKNTRVENIIQ